MSLRLSLVMIALSAIVGCNNNATDTDEKSDKVPRGTPVADRGAKPSKTAPSVKVSAPASADSADWPQFRGPGGQATSDATGLPTKFGDDENIVWKTELPGAGTSSPILIGDRIFLTCYSGFGLPEQRGLDMDDLKLYVCSLDRATGDLLWSKEVAPKLPEQETIRDEHGYSSSTPAADAERIYVFFGKTGVFAFDYDGEQLWHAHVGSDLNGWGSAASPVLYGDLVVINASVESQSLVALDKATGDEKWRADGINEAWNTPLLVTPESGRAELIVAVPQEILAFDPLSGERLWTCDTNIQSYMSPSVVAHGEVIYCVGGRTNGSLAVKAGGMGDVTKTHRLWTGTKGSNVSSPVYHEGHVYWMNDSQAIAFCADAESGDIVYEERMPRSDQVYASPVVADGKLYYISRSGQVFVVAAKPEFELLAKNQLEERGRFDASPAVADGRLFIRSNRYLYCFDEP